MSEQFTNATEAIIKSINEATQRLSADPNVLKGCASLEISLNNPLTGYCCKENHEKISPLKWAIIQAVLHSDIKEKAC